MLCESVVNGGSSSVRNMACEQSENSFQYDAHRNAAIQTLESCKTLSDAHEEKKARVQACEVSVLFTPPRRLQGKSPLPASETSCKKFFIDGPPILKKSNTFATLSNLSKTKLVKTRKENLSKYPIFFASILRFVVPQWVFVEFDDSEEWWGGEGGGGLLC